MNFKKFLAILIIGGIGGVLLNNLVLPSLIQLNFLGSAGILKFFVKPQIQTVIQNKEKTILIEPDFWKEIIPKTKGSVVLVQYFSGNKLLTQSNGIILTNDGLISVPLSSVPRGYPFIQVFFDSRVFKAKIVFKDIANNLALIKADEQNLPIFDFADNKDIFLGENLLILGRLFKVNQSKIFIQASMAKEIDDRVIFLDTQKVNILGSALINSKGKLAGMVQVNNRGDIFAVKSEILKNLIDKYLKSNQKVI